MRMKIFSERRTTAKLLSSNLTDNQVVIQITIDNLLSKDFML